MPIRSTSSSPDPFSSLNGSDTPIQSFLSVKEDKPSLSPQEPKSPLVSKKISSLTDEHIQQDPFLNNVVLYVGVEGKKLITESIIGKKPEELEAALVRNELGTIEKTEDHGVVVKFPEQRAKELESLGITSVEVREPSGGVRTYTSFNFQTLSDRELNLLITHVKTYIVFLKTQADPNDKKTEKAIEHLELKLKYLEIERAIRTNDPRLKDLLEGLVKDSPYKIAMRLAELWAHQKAVKEKREEEEEQKFWETKHIIILKEIFKWELHLNIIKEAVLKNDVDSHDLLNGFVKQEAINKNLMNIGRFINIYNALSKVE